ncbi:MAG: hypothetical protein ACXACY_21145 [Candidatus Hodarchaeales archaeon]|jgi:hypothetical protein
MGNKVQCRFCAFEIDRKCVKKKNSKVNLKKKRSCDIYHGDEEKIMVYAEKKADTIKPETTLRPDWFWSRSNRRKERDKIIQQEMERYQTTAGDSAAIAQPQQNSQYPVTGDLSRFMLDTGIENEEN